MNRDEILPYIKKWKAFNWKFSEKFLYEDSYVYIPLQAKIFSDIWGVWGAKPPKKIFEFQGDFLIFLQKLLL